MSEFKHIPVLLEETIASLDIKPEGTYVDGTVGGGGHSYEIAKRLDKSKGGRLICIDQDEEALQAAKERLKEFGDLVTFKHSNYSNMQEILQEENIEKVDGILLDIGVSSYQLDNAERGFTYMVDTALDMRMDKRNPLSALKVVNEYPKEELARVIRDYGEDKFANNIAKHIIEQRQKGPIETTGQLSEIIKAAIPMKVRKNEKHPEKRTFQAIRIEVNNELGVLSDIIDEAVDLLKPSGILSIITFHSLEDRIVKNLFKKNENPCICPKNFPVCTCGRLSKGRVKGKVISASEEELILNSRAKSAKLRSFVHI
ncbi:MAG: 16S rRNA (cytosine(1402)-N(4))-methyltransferase RsmH [Lachnospiraceae bacterium]|nr:16S rRNA (cytosine(1402)-N(4))-methyltransferase RsmH [Lachnospiraceae bacterium]